MLGVGVFLTSRTGPPGWVTPGASADLRFKDGLYYAAAPRALADIPGETSSGGVNGTVVRDGVIVRTTALDDDFTGYADQAAAETAGWVFGTGTTLDAANNQIDYSAAADATAVRKTLSLVAGVEYEVEMVVSNYVGGGLRVFVGGAVVVSTASANGTFTGTFTASATSPFMDLRATDVTTASIDSITIRRADTLPRIGDDGLLVEGAATNKAYAGDVEPSQLLTPTSQTAFETAFPDLDAFDAGAGALFGVVDRSADIVGTEIASLLPNGRVYVIDNTSGSGVALINFAGLTGNTNQHTSSAWIWSDTATSINEIGLGLNPASAKNLTSNVTASPQRFAYTETPSDANRKLQVSVAVGHRAYFVLPQFEEGSTATSYIPTAGSSVTRTADSVTLTDLDALGLTSAVLGELDTPLDDDFTSYADQAAAETAGWASSDAAGTFDAAGDQWDVSGAQSANFNILKTATVVSGNTYVVEAVVTRTAGALRVVAKGTGEDITTFYSASGTYQQVVDATSTSLVVGVRVDSNFQGSFDSITIRRAEPLGGYTVVVEWDAAPSGGNQIALSVDDGGSDNRNQFGSDGNAGSVSVGSASGGVANYFDTDTGFTRPYKQAGRFASNDSKVYANGTLTTTDAGFVMPVGVDRIRLGRDRVNTAYLNGFIRRLTIIPRAVSDAELQSLSS